jgi:hypothetical protein
MMWECHINADLLAARAGTSLGSGSVAWKGETSLEHARTPLPAQRQDAR